jgi:hypothetical protein
MQTPARTIAFKVRAGALQRIHVNTLLQRGCRF